MSITDKQCRKCRQTKLLYCFWNNKNNIDGKHYYCTGCCSKYQRNKYAKDTGRTIDQVGLRKSKIINGKKWCSRCGLWRDTKDFYKRLDDLSYECRSCIRINGTNNRRLHNKILKTEFIEAYGGGCVCCGETEFDFLTIEHIRYKGYKLIDSNGYELLRKLKALNWPKKEYTVLCYNCNLSTKYGKVCPHKRKR